MDNIGQLSLEFVMIVMISILLGLLVSFPLANLSLDVSNDVVDAVSYKNELTKISEAIDYCYASGRGSKKVVLIDLKQDCEFSFLSNNENSIVECSIKLKNQSKDLKIYSNAPIVSKKLYFSKGFNKLLVEWSSESNSIDIIGI